jgi:2-keto-3-deoxy-L-rhamnonate aldolase RhmA
MAGHSPELAQQVVDAGAVPLLVLCVQEPELALKRVAASALSDVAKHTPELAQAVVDAGAVAYLAPLVVSQDAKLKRQVGARLGWQRNGAPGSRQQCARYESSPPHARI